MTGTSTENLWYIARDGQQHGPISDTEMRLFVDNGHLRPTDLLWRPGFSEWRPASSVFSIPAAKAPEFPPPGPDAAAEKVASEPASASATAAQPTNTAQATSAASESAAWRAGEKPAEPSGSAAYQGEVSSTPRLAAAMRSAQASGAQASAGQVASGQVSAGPSPSNAAGSSAAFTSPAPSRQQNPAAASPGPAAGSAGMGAPGMGPGLGATGQPAQSHPTQRGSPPRGASPNSGPMGQSAGARAPARSGPQPNPNPNLGSPSMAAGSYSTTGPTDSAAPRTEAAPVANPGRSRKLATAAVLLGLIGGSFGYVISHKDDVVALISGGSGSEVPVVKADRAPQLKTEQETAALQRPAQPEQVEPPAPIDSNQQTPTNNTQPDQTAASQSIINPTARPYTEDAPSAIDTYYQQSKLWQYLKRSYPDWYGERMSAVAALGNGSEPARDATKSLVEGLVALRRQHANEALQANTGMLKAIAAAFLVNLQSLADKGPDACYGFISQGETSPKSVDLFHKPQSSPELEGQALAIFEAVAAGKATPTQHERPKKGDYDVLAAELGKLGWSQADLQLFADPKALSTAPPARVCSMVRDWFKAHIAISDASVQERLLYETLRPVVAG